MRLTPSIPFAVLVLSIGAVAVPSAHAQRSVLVSAPSPALASVTDRVRAAFPSARSWFRLVAGARFASLPDGSLVPDHASLTHPRIRRADNAGHTVLPRFARDYRDFMRIGLGDEAEMYLEVAPRSAQSSTVRVEDGVVVYHDAFIETDVLYKSTPTHTDEYFYLRSASAPTEWRFTVRYGAGIAALRSIGNALEAVDRDGIARLRASRPLAIDAHGTRREGTVTLDGTVIVLRIDPRGLVYPVLVDPDWTSTGDMAFGRFYFGANVLADGRVLATGGCSASVCSGDLTLPACRTVVGTAETLSLTTRTWSNAGVDPVPRFFHSSVGLANGEVVLAGGCTTSDCSATTGTVRVYDGTFRAAPDLSEARAGMVAARLPDGRVLLAGGCNSTACTATSQIYDPVRNQLVTTIPMNVARGRAEVVTLADGRILAVGGCTSILCAGVLDSAEIYDPATDSWTSTAPMGTPRAGHHATVLLDGSVLVGGGCRDQRCVAFLRSTEIFDPWTRRFSPGPDQAALRVGARAARLPDGTVMVNEGCSDRAICDTSNERYVPDMRAFTTLAPAVTTRAFHELVVHETARVIIAIGGCQPGTCSWWNESYDTSAIPVVQPPVDAGMDASGDALGDIAGDSVVPFDAGARDVVRDERPAIMVRATCGCRIVGAPSRAGGLWVVFGVALVALARARRQTRVRRAGCAAVLAVCGSACGGGSTPDADTGVDNAIDANDDVLDVAAEDTQDTRESAVCAAPCGVCQACVDGGCVSMGTQAYAAGIGIGWNHSLAITSDATLRTWGSNGYGELGLGDQASRDVGTLVTSPGAGWQRVVAGSRHSCGIRTDGTLWCWGVNVHGQLGVGDTTPRLVPTQVGTDANWAEVQCGGLHSCGIRTDGSLWCWGANPAGQLGLGVRTGDQPTPQHVGTGTDWRRLAAKARFNCALRTGDSLWCWGDNSDGQVGTGDTMDRMAPTQVLMSYTWSWVRMGPMHTCAITTLGELYCWGANESGQLGNGTTVASLAPVRVGAATDWTRVSGGFSDTCGLRGSGDLYCWGANSGGQLGLGDTANRTAPTAVNAGTAYGEVLLGMSHTCALTNAGSVQCWGQNSWGQVGDANVATATSPTPACFGP